MKEIVEEMLKGELVNEATGAYISQMIIAAALLGKLFLMVDLFHNYLRTTLRSKGTAFFDVSRVIKGGIIIFIIWMYYPIFGFIDYLLEAINGLTAPDLDIENSKINAGDLGQLKTGEVLDMMEMDRLFGSNGESVSIWDVIMSMGFKKVIFVIIDGIAMAFCFIVGLAVQIFALVAHRILFTLGPFALAFSILPYFEQARNRWMGAFVQTLFVFTILNVLNANVYEIVMMNLTAEDAVMNDIDVMDLIVRVGLNVSIFALYLSSFYLAGLIIGTGDTIGQAFNSSINTASSVVQHTRKKIPLIRSL